MRIEVHFDGRPVAYSRPRFRGKWNPKGAGTKQAQRQLEDLTLLVRKALREHGSRWNPEYPVSIEIKFGFAPAKGVGGRGRKYGYVNVIVEQIDDPERYYPNEPDVDNLSKLVMEALQHGGAVTNDSCVVVLEARKVKDWR